MKRLMLIAMTLGLIAAGCVPYPGSTRFPYGASLDRHNFVSTWDMPLSIAVEDAITDEELVLIHIPVGQMLVIDFEHELDNVPAQTTALPAETVKWEIVDPGTMIDFNLENKMDLPGHPVRLRVIRRDTPEIPPQPTADTPMTDAPAPAPGPADAEPTTGPMPERGPATMEQPETMVPPRRAEPAAEDDGNHVLDSQPDESMNRPVIEPDVEVEAEPEPEPDEPDPAAEPAPEAEDEPLGEDLEDVLGVSDVY